MKQPPIKLFEIQSFTRDASLIRRFQDQLSLGTDRASYALEDGVMRYINTWSKEEDTILTEEEYEIVNDINEMRFQKL